MNNPCRLFVSLSAPLYREALLQTVLQDSGWLLSGESSLGFPTLDALSRSPTDLLLIEENLPDQDGLSIAELALMENPRLRILLLVDQFIPERRLQIYLQAGIRSVISKTQTLQALMKALQRLRNGSLYVDPGVCQSDSPQPANWDSLSQREQEVARYLAERLDAKQIADRLGLSYKTVHSYKDRILQKLGLDKPAELLLVLQRHRQEWDH